MKKKRSLRFQITVVLLAFDLLILGLIYFFQMHFLDDFYYDNKIKDMVLISDDIVNHIAKNDIESLVEETSYLNEVCVRIESHGSTITGSNGNSVCALSNLNDQQVNKIAEQTLASGGRHLFQDYRLAYPFDNKDLFIFGQTIRYDGQMILVMVSTTVEPLNATIRTIQSQYLVIATILIIVTIMLALLISKMVIKPINHLSLEAEKLPQGKYNNPDIKINSKELIELNNTLTKANEEINKADKARKELLANVSHDLRTPLTMIVGYGEMMRDIEGENNEENINVIINEAKRLSSLVDDLLDVSRLESNQVKMHLEEVSLNEFLSDVYDQYLRYCQSLDIEFKLELANDAVVKMDKKYMSQVLYNFINNALNYNNSEHKIIKLISEEVGDRYKVTVYDNGQGIKKEDLNKIWDRYYKVDKEHFRFHLGSGIGLSLAKKLLELHNFEFGVESEYGEYSCFYFYIDKE